MKKLMFLILVVGIASSANARMVLELQMGDADTVDIVATAGYLTGDDIYFFVFGDTSLVTVSGGTVGVKEPIGPVPKDTEIYDDPIMVPQPPPSPFSDGVWGLIGAIAGGDCPPGVIIEEIEWSLVGGATEAEISLFNTTDFVTFNTLSTITVPEPMTIALLGLGGLFVLRRRK
jgi:hypothetical protein